MVDDLPSTSPMSSTTKLFMFDGNYFKDATL